MAIAMPATEAIWLRLAEGAMQVDLAISLALAREAADALAAAIGHFEHAAAMAAADRDRG